MTNYEEFINCFKNANIEYEVFNAKEYFKGFSFSKLYTEDYILVRVLSKPGIFDPDFCTMAIFNKDGLLIDFGSTI